VAGAPLITGPNVQAGADAGVQAATAVATRRTIVTTDRAARFSDLQGVDSVVIGS